MNRHANRIAKAKRKLQDALKRGDTRAQHHALAKLQKATTAALKYEVANGPIQSKAPAGESLGGLFDALGGVVSEIIIPYPPSANRLWRNVGGKTIKSEEYRLWLATASWEIRAQRPARIDGPYTLEIVADAPDRRGRDIDNLIKPISDVLKLAGVYADDKAARKVSAEWSDVAPAKGAQVRARVTPIATEKTA